MVFLRCGELHEFTAESSVNPAVHYTASLPPSFLLGILLSSSANLFSYLQFIFSVECWPVLVCVGALSELLNLSFLVTWCCGSQLGWQTSALHCKIELEYVWNLESYRWVRKEKVTKCACKMYFFLKGCVYIIKNVNVILLNIITF